jgi:hypothetical protein
MIIEGSSNMPLECAGHHSSLVPPLAHCLPLRGSVRRIGLVKLWTVSIVLANVLIIRFLFVQRQSCVCLTRKLRQCLVNCYQQEFHLHNGT